MFKRFKIISIIALVTGMSLNFVSYGVFGSYIYNVRGEDGQRWFSVNADTDKVALETAANMIEQLSSITFGETSQWHAQVLKNMAKLPAESRSHWSLERQVKSLSHTVEEALERIAGKK
jgi:hypothetical protein